MNTALVLWADGAEDFIKILVAILFVALPLVGKVINMLSNNANPAKRPAPPPVPMKPRVPPNAANPQLNTEVEEFLRRAAERRAAEQRREVATPSQKAEQSTPRRPPPAREEPPKPRKKKKSREPMKAEVLDDVKRGSDVADHVAQHFKPHAVLDRAQTAKSVDQADEAMQDHVHAVFDHQLGLLDRAAGKSSEPAPDSQRDQPAMQSADLANMLRDPQSVRQAIVLSEILSRPEHRW